MPANVLLKMRTCKIASHILDDNSIKEPAHKQFSESGSEFIWLSWIRIRIRNADPDLDSGARKLTKKT
jgi:hypothetical protein